MCLEWKFFYLWSWRRALRFGTMTNGRRAGGGTAAGILRVHKLNPPSIPVFVSAASKTVVSSPVDERYGDPVATFPFSFQSLAS